MRRTTNMPERDTIPQERKADERKEKEIPGLSLTDLITPSDWNDRKSLDKRIQSEVDTLGKDGSQALLDAVRKHRVVGVGEVHTNGDYPNSILFLLTKMMPEFKKVGVTHLALEANKRDHQSTLEETNKTKRFEPKTKRGIAFNDDWNKMLEAAAVNGIKLVAVDDNPVRELTLTSPITLKENQHRENFMAKEIADIVNSDPSARVLWPVGDLHMIRRTGRDGYRWAGQQLSEYAQKNGWSYTNFASSMATPFDPLQRVQVDKPTAVNLKDAKTLGGNPTSMPQMKEPRMPDSKVGDFDSILFVPWNLELLLAEKELGSKSEKLLPLLEKSIESYGVGIPNHTLALCQKALPIEEKMYGAKSPHVALRLLMMAKCCSHLNREEEATKYSERGYQILTDLGK